MHERIETLRDVIAQLRMLEEKSAEQKRANQFARELRAAMVRVDQFEADQEV